MSKHMKYLKKKKADKGLLKDPKDSICSKKSILQSLYNWEENKIIGRTPKGWAQIILFYIIFYILLSAIFAFCMWVVVQTLDLRKPKWKLGESLIGTNPGLGFRPTPQKWKIGNTLIWYRVTGRGNYTNWVNNLEEFLQVYKNPGLTPGREQNICNCNYEKPPGFGQVCDVDIESWYPCTLENNFNYHNASPCIFLKLNKIYGWVPEYYNSTNDLPRDMPASLKNHIANISITRPHELNTVWVTCEGENSVDNENLGRINYIPRQGFPGYFYPYENVEGYLSPIVAIHIVSPTKGVIINIECKAWAKNIKPNRPYQLGCVHLELMID